MTTKISQRDWEALSAYLDGQLSSGESSRLEQRIQNDDELRAALDEIRRTRGVLRSQALLRAPRNFTLTPQMAGIRPKASVLSRTYPIFRLASTFASILLVLVLVGDLLGGFPVGKHSEPASAPLSASQADRAVYDTAIIPTVEEEPAATVEIVPQVAPDVSAESAPVTGAQSAAQENQTYALQAEGAPAGAMAKAAPSGTGSVAGPLMQASGGGGEPSASPSEPLSAPPPSLAGAPMAIPEAQSENTYIPLQPLTSTVDVSMAAVQTPSDEEFGVAAAETSTSVASSLPQLGTKAAFAMVVSDTPLPPTPFRPIMTPVPVEPMSGAAYPSAQPAAPPAEGRAALPLLNWAEIVLAVVALSTGLVAFSLRPRERK